jgi:hypothetical protein
MSKSASISPKFGIKAMVITSCLIIKCNPSEGKDTKRKRY